MADRCATAPRSMHSCTLEDARRAKPVCRQAMTSECSAKMEMLLVATFREAAWMTAGFSSPAIRYMVGIMSIMPWLAV